MRARATLAATLKTWRTANKTRMAAAATCWYAASGRETQLKIWIGKAVKGSNGASKRPLGWRNASRGDSIPPGVDATKTAAPTIKSGAVSPIAREMARITPVTMPGMAVGKTW